MACGNAIVASNTGDTDMFINKSNGILINLNRDELAEALKVLITNREKTKQLGLAAQKYVKENHTIEKFTDYYVDLILRVHKSKISELTS
jgi:glycosyltransferase involved in cell wall biosynthesis